MQKHNIILAGCGGMSNVWLDYVKTRKNAEIKGLVDINIETAKAMAVKRDLNVPIFTDLKQALENVEANLVIDVTIPSSHKDIVTTALRSGCHVFGEKPMAETIEDAKEILTVVEETGMRHAVMQNRRYLKHVRALQHILHAGEIGTVGSIHADFFLGPHFGGFRDVMDHPLILDMAIHTFDQARFMIGADPVSVYCQEYNPPGSWYKGNASAVCIFEMSNGSLFSYRGSWCAEGLNTSWESDWRITGSMGSVRWNGTDRPICEIVDQSKSTDFINSITSVEIPDIWEGQEGHFGCLDDMFASLEQGRPAETNSADNFQSVSMVFGAIESAKSGKKIMF